jgi:hypothetical protein
MKCTNRDSIYQWLEMLQLDGVYGLLLLIVMQEENSSFKNCKDFGHEEVSV